MLEPVQHPDAAAEMWQAVVAGIRPDEELWLDSWSEENVVIPKGGAFEGPYRLTHTPYARRLLQALSPAHPASIIVAKVASQMLKTQVAINACLGWIDGAPANILALEPTTGLAKRLSARISKAIKACDKVRDKVAEPRSRDRRNTMDAKEFDGGTLYITTAGSDANLAEIACRYVFCDEIDREGWKAGDEGNRIGLALARLTTYEGISKAYLVSSPTLIGSSEIDDWFERGTQESYHVPCPHCGHLHKLDRANFRYTVDEDTDIISAAFFACPECGGVIEEHDKATMLPSIEDGGQARWIAASQGDGEVISLTLSAYYAPLGSITWRKLAKELHLALKAKGHGDNSLLMVYENTREGIVHDPGEVSSDAQQLLKRAQAEGLPARIVPDRALVLTQYADTQDQRLEVTTEAWGPGMEHWTIDRQIIMGNPAIPADEPGSPWAKLDEIRRTPYAHASGALIYVSAYGVDSGGNHTQDVYNYGAARTQYNCVVTKGSSQRAKPIIASRPTSQDIDWQGRRVDGGVQLWMLGTDTAKDWLFNRLNNTHGFGAAHWYAQLELEAYEQLLVEKPVVRWHKGRKIREYVKPNGARNEFLDCAVGNLALAHYLGLHKWSANDWDHLRKSLIPKHLTPDLFAAAAAAEIPKQPEQVTQPHPIDTADPGGPAPQPMPQPAPPAPPPAPPAPPPARPAPPRAAVHTGRRMLSRGIR